MSLVSKYFEASTRFESMAHGSSAQGSENRMVEIDLNGMDEEIVKAFINFAYTGKLKITSENFHEILTSVDFLSIQLDFYDVVVLHLAGYDLDRFLELLEFAHSKLSKSNVPACYRTGAFFARSFYKYYADKKYLKLILDVLVKVLCSNNLVVMEEIPCGQTKELMFVTAARQEEIVFECIIQYARHNSGESIATQTDLLSDLIPKIVRLDLIPKKTLHSLADRYPELKRSSEFHALFPRKDAESGRGTPKGHRYGSPDVQRDLIEVLAIQWSDPIVNHTVAGLIEDEVFDDADFIKNFMSFNNSKHIIYVMGMKMCQRHWRENQGIIGELEMAYSNGYITYIGMHRADSRAWSRFNLDYRNLEFGHPDLGPGLIESYDISLHPDERIIKVIAFTGDMINSLTFETNTGRILGPYGGQGGTRVDIERPSSSAYLAFIKGKIAKTDTIITVRHLQFGWVYSKDFAEA